MLGESGFTLTCCVSGSDHLNPLITYLWTMDNGTCWTQIQDGPDPRTISFDPLRVSALYSLSLFSSLSSLMPIMLVRTSQVLFSLPSLMSVPWISQTRCLRRSCIPSWSCTGHTVRGCSIASSELHLMRWVNQYNSCG